MEGNYRWLVEPRDQQTNEAIFRVLPFEEIQELSYEGETIRVVECPWKLVDFLSRIPSLNFNLYVRKDNGPVLKANCVIRSKKF